MGDIYFMFALNQLATDPFKNIETNLLWGCFTVNLFFQHFSEGRTYRLTTVCNASKQNGAYILAVWSESTRGLHSRRLIRVYAGLTFTQSDQSLHSRSLIRVYAGLTFTQSDQSLHGSPFSQRSILNAQLQKIIFFRILEVGYLITL
jgi:hypothetical protein